MEAKVAAVANLVRRTKPEDPSEDRSGTKNALKQNHLQQSVITAKTWSG